ncbi:unnamed protein product [Amoebophrya sp. A25]|nr:unnamed protein product [Amoebophrya sp. A25]|eukprot:GSA25T00022847001.1
MDRETDSGASPGRSCAAKGTKNNVRHLGRRHLPYCCYRIWRFGD